MVDMSSQIQLFLRSFIHNGQSTFQSALSFLDPSTLPTVAADDDDDGKVCVFTYVSFTVSVGYILCSILAAFLLGKLLQTSRRRPQKLFLLMIVAQSLSRFLFFFLWPLRVLSDTCAPASGSSASIILDMLGTLPVCLFISAFSLYVLTFARVHQLFQLHYNRWSTTCIVTFYRVLVIAILALNILSYTTTIGELITPSHSKVYDLVEQSSVYFISFGVLLVAFSFVFIIRSLFNTIEEYIQLKQAQAAEEEALYYDYEVDPAVLPGTDSSAIGYGGDSSLQTANPMDYATDHDHVVFSSPQTVGYIPPNVPINSPSAALLGAPPSSSTTHELGLYRKNSGTSSVGSPRDRRNSGSLSNKGGLARSQKDPFFTTPMDTFTMTINGNDADGHAITDSSDDDTPYRLGMSRPERSNQHGHTHSHTSDSFSNPFDPQPIFSLPQFDGTILKNVFSGITASSSHKPAASQGGSDSHPSAAGASAEQTLSELSPADTSSHLIEPTGSTSLEESTGYEPTSSHPHQSGPHNPLRRLLVVSYINCLSLTIKAVFLPIMVLIFKLSIPPILIGFYYFITEIFPSFAMLLTFNVASASTSQWSSTYTDDGSFGYHDAVLSLIQSRREEQRQRELLLNGDSATINTSGMGDVQNNIEYYQNYYDNEDGRGEYTAGGSRRGSASSMTSVGTDDNTPLQGQDYPLSSSSPSAGKASGIPMETSYGRGVPQTPRRSRGKNSGFQQSSNDTFSFSNNEQQQSYDDGSHPMGASPSLSRFHHSHISAFPSSGQPNSIQSPVSGSSHVPTGGSVMGSFTQPMPGSNPSHRAQSKRAVPSTPSHARDRVSFNLPETSHERNSYAQHQELTSPVASSSTTRASSRMLSPTVDQPGSIPPPQSQSSRKTPVKSRNSLLTSSNRSAGALLTTAAPTPQSPAQPVADENKNQDEFRLFFGTS